MTRAEMASLADLWNRLNDLPSAFCCFREKLAAFPEVLDRLNELEGTITRAEQSVCRMLKASSSADNPLSTGEIAQVVQFNRRLRAVTSHLLDMAKDVFPRMDAKIADPADSMADFEVEVELAYVLREDDPEFGEDEDNILTFRTECLTGLARTAGLDDKGFIGPSAYHDMVPEPHCWLFHDIYDHAYGPGRPSLSFQDCARIGKAWVDVKVWQQYCFDVDKGAWEKRFNQSHESSANTK